MAIITIARQVASLGDEIATACAEKLGYTFIERKQIEKRIVELGFPAEKMSKYDEKKTGFFASLVKERDEYLNYLQYAVLEAACKGNCILIGRGSFAVLDGIKNLVSLRFVSSNDVRVERLKSEWNWNEKQAQQRIDESDNNRNGFHKSFFNIDNENPEHYLLTMNTGLLSVENSVDIISSLLKMYVTVEKESEGQKQIEKLFIGQKLVNSLMFEYHINVNFLHAVVEDDKIILQGVADSQGVAEKAVQAASSVMSDYEICSSIRIVQDYKTYQ